MVKRVTERRHGTYIHAARDVHVGHALTIRRGLFGLSLFCNDCQESAIEAGGNGCWRGVYELPDCRS